MKEPVEKRKPQGILDYLALGLTTFGVGYIPGAPGTYGSAVAVLIYLGVTAAVSRILGSNVMFNDPVWPFLSAYPTYGIPQAILAGVFVSCFVGLLLLCLIGIWASGRTIQIFGRKDPPQAVVDEVMGQLITFCFIPFGLGWPFIIAGFLLFRLFDIWKPYPIRDLEVLPGGLGICADDIVAGVYAGICLAIGYAVYLAI